MADQYSVGVGAISLSSATLKTLIEVQGSASSRGLVKAWGISFNGTSSDVPVLVEVIRATAGITGTTIVPAQVDPAAAAAQATVKHSASGEGTPASVALETYYVTPNGGLFLLQYPLGDEHVFTSTSFVRVRATAPTAVSASIHLRIAE